MIRTLSLLLLCGCSSAIVETAPPTPSLRTDARFWFQRALGMWREVHMRHLVGEERQAALDETLRLLRASRTSTPGAPQVLDAEARVLREMSRDDEAESVLEALIARHQAWIPAHLELAQLALDRGERAQAEASLARAADLLAAALDPLPDGPRGAISRLVRGRAREVAEAERARVIGQEAALASALSWRVDARTSSPTSPWSKLHAEAVFIAAQLVEPWEHGAPRSALDELAAVLALDPDHFRARLELGLADWRQGDLDSAIAFLEPQLDDGLPLVRAHPETLGRVAQLYVERYADEGDVASLVSANERVLQLLEEHPTFGQGALTAAHLIVVRVRRGESAENLARAEELLARVEVALPPREDGHVTWGHLDVLRGWIADLRNAAYAEGEGA